MAWGHSGFWGVFVLVLVLLGVSPRAHAQSNETFVLAEGVAVAATEAGARENAYYQAFNTALRRVMGDVAATCVGIRFRQELGRGLNAFRRRYFSPDTLTRCQPNRDGAGFYCEVDGQVDFSALRQAVKQYLGEDARLPAYRFVAAVARGLSQDQARVFDQLNGEFAYYNYRVFTGRVLEELVRAHRADFALGFSEITFSNFVWEPNLRQLSGVLAVRFRLTDQRTGEIRSVTPITVEAAVPGTNRQTLQPLLVQKLAVRVARSIARATNEEIAECAEIQVDYRLRLAGIDVGARTTRALRLRLTRVLESLGFSDVETDYEASGEEVTVLRFLGRDDLSPDAVVDALYEAFGSDSDFFATYRGNRIFEIGFE